MPWNVRWEVHIDHSRYAIVQPAGHDNSTVAEGLRLMCTLTEHRPTPSYPPEWTVCNS